MNIGKKRIKIVLAGLLLAGLSAPGMLLAQSLSDFECVGNAKPVMHAFSAEESSYKENDHYCVNKQGKRQGPTRISTFDHSLQSPWTYIEGQYHNGRAVGKWTIISVEDGEVLGECFFVDGVLSRGDPSCENI